MNPHNELIHAYKDETLKQFEDYLSLHDLHGIYSMIMQAPAAVAVFSGPDFIAEIANDTCLAFADKLRENFIGKSLFQAVPELKGQEIEEVLRGILISGKPVYANDFKISLVRSKKNEDLFFDFICQPLKTRNGETTGVIIVAYDVTPSVKAKFALAESERRFRNMVMKSPIGMAIFRGKDFVIEMVNDTLLRNIWHRELNEVQGKKLLDIFPELNDQRFPKLLEKVYESGISYTEREALTYVNIKAAGPGIYYLDFDYSPLFEPDGKTVSGIMVTVVDVTIQVNAKKKTEENELKYRNLIYGLQTAFYTCDRDGRIEIFNDAAVELWGKKPDADDRWTGAHKTYRADGSLLPNDQSPVALAVKTGKVVTGQEIIIERRDGTMLNVLQHPQLVFDKNGNVTGGMNMLVDITERKIVESNANRLAALVQSSEDAIISKTLEGIITSWNPGAERLFKYTAEEIVGQSVNLLLLPDHITEEVEILRRIGKGEQIKHFDSVRLAKGGRPIDVSLTISPIKDADGNVTGVSTIARDITEQKNLNKIISDSEQRLQLAVSAAELGAWEYNVKTGKFTCNERYLEITGFSKNERPTDKEIIEHIYGPDIAIEEKAVRAIEKTGLLDMEIRFIHPDKSLHWARVRGKMFYDEMNRPDRMIGTALDITMQKNAFEELENKVFERTQELKQANTALEKSNSDLEQFAYVASHDLQEPLRKIKTFVSRLQETTGERDEEKDKIYMEKIVSSAARMSKLIQDLLEYSKTGRLSEEHSLTDLNKTLEIVKNDFELLIQQKKAIIQSQKLPLLNAVPHQMTQLFANLISNSLKFAKEDISPVIKIKSSALDKKQIAEYELDPSQKYSEIVFSDNGVGFSNEFSEKVFEIFQRLNPRSAYGGSGIGLSICRKIVNNHGGIIFAESAESEGASFHIILPVEKENPEA